MKKTTCLLVTIFLFCACGKKQTHQFGIQSDTVEQVVSELSSGDKQNSNMIERGVKQIAKLWQPEDGDENDFKTFCLENYISDPEEKKAAFLKISEYMEAINGHFNEMTLQLQRNIHESTGELNKMDEIFAAYNPSTHLSDDFYANKTAFIIALNFPELSLDEKENLGNDRLKWAYARLGDMFTSRVPADLQQAYSAANSDADIYIANYNIYAGHLLNEKGKKLFPENMVLLSHWNLRDEIKANYNKGDEGMDKQRTIYEVMQRIVSQEIPVEVINSGEFDWNPSNNTLYKNGNPVEGTAENNVRYQKFLNNFLTLKAIDQYTGKTYIERNFDGSMEVSVEDAERLFDKFLSSPELKKIGELISERLGRDLEPFDIWYDGFKARSRLDEEKLSMQTRSLYPDANAMNNDLVNILQKLGFDSERAAYLTEKITVDAARGSGHAWGATMKGQLSHLRTRIPADGMDYKGYNIAIHEFGHNVEQTISMYDVDYYLLNGVPNTAFTEALAFMFQKRDLDILGIENNDGEKNTSDILDKTWSLYEICGVSMLDIAIWKWIYEHPTSDAEQLKAAVIGLSKEVWNKYFAPVFGKKDETVLAVYSHTISYPLYLSAYAYGQIIEFQLEEYMKDRDFAKEVDRIFRIGRLTPNQWMVQATGNPVSTEPLLNTLNSALK
jgi:hypothetical protein